MSTEFTSSDLSITSHSILKLILVLVTFRSQEGDELISKLSMICMAGYGNGKRDGLTKRSRLLEVMRGELGVGSSPDLAIT